MIAAAGTMSGPIGAVLVQGVVAVQAWVRHINDTGGINGHAVQYLLFDDGGDPARHKAQVKEAIERKHAIAFLYNPEGITGPGSVDYINSNRVPVIGSEGGGGWFYTSPMHFPQMPHYEAFFRIGTPGVASVAIPQGKTKLGTLTCVEIQSCEDSHRVFAESAEAAGLKVVYEGRTSVTQPDYSAECLAARNAGVEILMFGIDSASVARVALSCARQGYHPMYATIGSIAIDRMKEDTNLQDMVAPSEVFPYFESGTPATDEYQTVMKTYGYGSGGTPGVGTATGWVAAKLFEKVAADISEPPTSEAILQGLWSLRDETLGGITQPLTFVRDQPAKPRTCWFTMTVRERTWATTDGFQLHCL